jgi:hypothetical protein
MILTNDNNTLNTLIKNLIEAINATNAALTNDNISFEEIEAIDEKEAAADEAYINYIFEMMPAKTAAEMRQPKYFPMFKAKTFDKFILPFTK